MQHLACFTTAKLPNWSPYFYACFFYSKHSSVTPLTHISALIQPYHSPSSGYKAAHNLVIFLTSCPFPTCLLTSVAPSSLLFLGHSSNALTSSLCPGYLFCLKYSGWVLTKYGYSLPHISNEMSSQWAVSALFKLQSINSPTSLFPYTDLLDFIVLITFQ